MSRETLRNPPSGSRGNERMQALQLLRRIEKEESFASLLLQDQSGFVRTLVLGVLRWRSRLDFVIRTFATRRTEPELLDVLRLGVFQLLYMNVAPHAAVGETVELAPKRGRGFVNAILRRVSAENLPEPPNLSVRTAHPDWLIERWIRNYGVERAARIAEADQDLSFPDILTDSPPPGAQPSPFVDGMWRLQGSSANLEGLVLDEGSAVVASIAARTGRDILDLAAAPGGKSAVMRRLGAHVVSNDLAIGRLVALRHDLDLLVVSDGRMPPFRRSFETILLDAPCSATGTIRKNP
jgi:tRNA and rRNA cytosine-C5-methylases